MAVSDYKMPCISPINLNTPEGRVNVPCGRCHECKGRRRKDWQFRLYEELKIAKTSQFVTLTYTDETVPYADTRQVILKSDLQAFMKRLRSNDRYAWKKSGKLLKNKPRIRYYACGEYGDKTLRPHYHILLFNLWDTNQILKSWQNGNVHIGTNNVKTIAYTTKYIMKQYSANSKDTFAPFSLMSKGIGKNYLNNNSKYHYKNEQTTVRNPDGTRQNLPRYYKDKIFKSEVKKKAISEKNRAKFNLANIREEDRILSLGNKSIGVYQNGQIESKIQQINKSLNSKTI